MGVLQYLHRYNQRNTTQVKRPHGHIYLLIYLPPWFVIEPCDVDMPDGEENAGRRQQPVAQ